MVVRSFGMGEIRVRAPFCGSNMTKKELVDFYNSVNYSTQIFFNGKYKKEMSLISLRQLLFEETTSGFKYKDDSYIFSDYEVNSLLRMGTFAYAPGRVLTWWNEERTDLLPFYIEYQRNKKIEEVINPSVGMGDITCSDHVAN